MREPLNDELFDVVLKQAVFDADKADLEALPPDVELNETYQMPEQAKKEFARVQKAQTRGISTRRLLARRVAIITVTALAVIFGGLMLHPDIRAGVNHIVMQQFEKYNVFQHNDDGLPNKFLTVDDVEIGYIPDGFELKDKQEEVFLRHYFYCRPENENVYLAIDIALAKDNDMGLDNEHSYEIRQINHREAHISYNEEAQSGAIVMPGDPVIIGISGILPREELIKVAGNLF